MKKKTSKVAKPWKNNVYKYKNRGEKEIQLGIYINKFRAANMKKNGSSHTHTQN